MNIDPLEVIIKWLKLEFTPAQGRVAGKHRYGIDPVDNGWTTDQLGVVVRLEDGFDNLQGKTATVRLEIVIYGPERDAITDAWRVLAGLAKSKRRFTVETSLGTVLVHYFNQSSGFSFVYEDDLQLEMGVVFYQALIAKELIA